MVGDAAQFTAFPPVEGANDVPVVARRCATSVPDVLYRPISYVFDVLSAVCTLYTTCVVVRAVAPLYNTPYSLATFEDVKNETVPVSEAGVTNGTGLAASRPEPTEFPLPP